MKRSLLIIGIFTTVVSIVFFMFIMRTSSLMQGGTYDILAKIKDAAGLKLSTTVQMYGLKVGRIKSMELLEDTVLVVLEISRNVDVPVDSKLKKKPEGILGNAYLSIEPGVGRPLLEGESLQLADTSNFMDIVGDSAGKVTHNVEQLTRQLSEYLASSAVLENIDAITQELNIALVEINEILQTVRIASEQNAESIQAIVSATTGITTALEYFLVKDRDTQPNEELSQNLVSIRNILKNLDDLSAKINNGEGSLGQIINDDELYIQLKETTASLQETVESVNTVVDAATNLTSSLDYRFENLLSENAQYASKNHVNLILSFPDSSREYIIGVTHGGGDSLVSKEYPTLGTSNLKLNLQLGQKLFNDYVVLRGGIIENTAGFGFDVQIFKEWAVSAEIYNFGATPNLRAFTQVNPFASFEATDNPLRWIYINGGVDDILENYKRTYFIGVGLNFKDNFFYDAVRILPINTGIQSIGK